MSGGTLRFGNISGELTDICRSFSLARALEFQLVYRITTCAALGSHAGRSKLCGGGVDTTYFRISESLAIAITASPSATRGIHKGTREWQCVYGIKQRELHFPFLFLFLGTVVRHAVPKGRVHVTL